MRKRFYCQCKFIQSTGPDSHHFAVAWIPKERTIVGKWIRIDSREGNWQVVEVCSTKTEEDVLACERDYRRQRAVSDIER